MPLSAFEGQNSQLNTSDKLWLGGVLALTLATFASTFTFGWVYDDAPQIPGNADLRWGRLGYLFTHHLWASAAGNGITNARFYRPLLAVWFLINKTIFGLHPQWFHVTTVLAHVVATALAFFIARKVLRDAGGALLAAAIFGVHPLQAEAVSWISAVNDPLAAVFCFGSFLAWRRARKGWGPQARVPVPWGWWCLSAILFWCALLAKEVSIVLPGIMLMDLWCDADRETAKETRARSTLVFLGAYGFLAIIWLLVRHRAVGPMAAAVSGIGWVSALLTAPKILLWQLSRVILPAGLSPHYDFAVVTGAAAAKVVLAICGVIVLVALVIASARKFPRLWVAHAWLVFPLLPGLNIRWLNEDDFVHDRYMYMSMLGGGMLVGAGYVALKRRWPEQKLIPGLVWALVVGLAFTSAIQSQLWANDVALFARGVQIAPQNEWAQLDYGAALSARGKNAEAASHFAKSYELKAGWRAADYAGFAYQSAGDPVEAERWYVLALRQNPSLGSAWFALGQIRMAEQRPGEAILFFQRAIAARPDAEGYHFAIGSALEAAGNLPGALEAYRNELRLHPSQAGARIAIDRLERKPPGKEGNSAR